jgi:hypothetical protein
LIALGGYLLYLVFGFLFCFLGRRLQLFFEVEFELLF